MRGLTSSWRWSSTSMTQACIASPSCGAARPTPGASRIVWARSSSSPCRYLPKLSTGRPLSRRRGSPRRTMGRTLMAAKYIEDLPRTGRGVRRAWSRPRHPGRAGLGDRRRVAAVGRHRPGRATRAQRPRTPRGTPRRPAHRRWSSRLAAGASRRRRGHRRAQVGRPGARLLGELPARLRGRLARLAGQGRGLRRGQRRSARRHGRMPRGPPGVGRSRRSSSAIADRVDERGRALVPVAGGRE